MWVRGSPVLIKRSAEIYFLLEPEPCSGFLRVLDSELEQFLGSDRCERLCGVRTDGDLEPGEEQVKKVNSSLDMLKHKRVNSGPSRTSGFTGETKKVLRKVLLWATSARRFLFVGPWVRQAPSRLHMLADGGASGVKLLGRSFLIGCSRRLPLSQVVAAFVLLPHPVNQQEDEEDGKQEADHAACNNSWERDTGSKVKLVSTGHMAV